MKIRGNTIGTPLKPEKNLVKATDLIEEEKAQARANIGAVASVNGTTPDENGNVTVESDIYVVKVNQYTDEGAGTTWEIDSFSWDELCEAVKNEKTPVCRVTTAPTQENEGIIVNDYPLVSFREDLMYVIFGRATNASYIKYTIHADGTLERTNDAPGGITKKLLWENASPESSFAAQTISCTQLTQYQEVEVEFLVTPSSTYRAFMRANVSLDPASGLPRSGVVSFSPQGGNVYNRVFVGQSTSNGVYALKFTAPTTTTYLIPYRIYGIKG